MWVHDLLPRILPVGWRKYLVAEDGIQYVYSRQGKRMSVIASGTTELDNRRWLHVSVASPDALPTYDDLVSVKELFIGRDKKAVQVFPPRSQHVNIHKHCLHLWHCIDEDPLPDFTQGGDSL